MRRVFAVAVALIGNALPASLGQTVFVENRPGARQHSRLAPGAAADPDGYTLMVSAASGLIMSPMIYKNAGYDAASFAPVALIAETPQLLVVNPNLPVRSVAELIAFAKANPGKLNYSTGGTGTLSHLPAELVQADHRHPDRALALQGRRAGAHGRGDRRLDRAAGAARYAAGHNCQAQCRHQCGAQRRADEKRARQSRCAGARAAHRRISPITSRLN